MYKYCGMTHIVTHIHERIFHGGSLLEILVARIGVWGNLITVRSAAFKEQREYRKKSVQEGKK